MLYNLAVMKNISWLSDRIGYFDSPTTSAIIRLSEDEACIVDTGINFESGRKIFAALKREGLKPIAIINSHSHADHYGGNSFFLKKGDIEVYFPAGEASIGRFPIWEPFYLYGGLPPKELKVPFLMPEKTSISQEISPGKLKLTNTDINIVDLSGHSLFQIGIEVDGFLYAADSLFSPDLWEKHSFIYYADFASSLETIKKIKGMNLKGIILSHRGYFENVKEITAYNEQKLTRLFEAVLNEVKDGLSTDEILMKSAEKFAVNLTNLPSYFLARQTVLSILTFAKEKDMVNFFISEKGISWKKI